MILNSKFHFCSFESIGWMVHDKKKGYLSSLKRPLFPKVGSEYTNMRGREIRVAVVDNFPFFRLKTDDDGNILPDIGIDASVILTLSEALNFK